ncbi:MAG: hypothetical protein AB8B71_18380 [Paracoccaceae bacterium]
MSVSTYQSLPAPDAKMAFIAALSREYVTASERRKDDIAIEIAAAIAQEHALDNQPQFLAI